MSGAPDSWRVVKLGDVADTALGKMLDAARPKGDIRVPYLRNVNVQWGRVELADVLDVALSCEERERFSLEEGDLLVCEGGEVGRAAIWSGGIPNMAYQKALHRVRSRGELDLRYLRYLLEHYASTGALASRATGSTIQHLPQQQLRELPVPLPDITVQTRIVEILEDHLSRLDAAQRLLTNGLQRVETWRRVTLDALVRETAAGTTRLGALVERVEAGKSLGGSAPPAGPGDWGVIKVSAMTWGEFRPQENKKIPADKADPRYEIRPGDVLVSRANTTEYVGAPVYVDQTPKRLLLSDKSLRLVPNEGVENRWLATVLAARSTRIQVSALATGTKDSMRNISQQSLLSVTVPRATPDQQTHVVRRAKEVEDAAMTLGRDLERGASRARALRKALLVAAFSGLFVS